VSPRYLMIGREGSTGIFFTEDPPTEYDIGCVQVGTLQIIRLTDLHCMDANGGWTQIDEGAITTVEIDGEQRGPFHVPRSTL
jgi:hypothetical protein